MKKYYIKLFPKVLANNAEKKYENYTFESPKSICSNIVFGTMYVEPVDTVKVYNHDTGDTATIQYFARGWGEKNIFK